jgi:hypothetical protein
MALKPAPIDVKLAVFKLRDTGGTLRTLTCALNGVTLNMEAEEVEFETLCNVEKIAGNVSASIEFSGRYDGDEDEIDEVMYNLVGALATEFQFFPSSEESANHKYHGSGVVSAYNISADAPGIVQVSGTMAVTGKPGRTVVS